METPSKVMLWRSFAGPPGTESALIKAVFHLQFPSPEPRPIQNSSCRESNPILKKKKKKGAQPLRLLTGSHRILISLLLITRRSECKRFFQDYKTNILISDKTIITINFNKDTCRIHCVILSQRNYLYSVLLLSNYFSMNIIYLAKNNHYFNLIRNFHREE